VQTHDSDANPDLQPGNGAAAELTPAVAERIAEAEDLLRRGKLQAAQEKLAPLAAAGLAKDRVVPLQQQE